jgi:hypothetical protein
MRVTAEALGAWVVKCNPDVTDFGSLLHSGEAIRTWCVADNYRTAMMDAGDQVALWVSGSAGARFPRGIWGIGRVRGPALPKPPAIGAGPARARTTLVAQIDISLWETPIMATEMATVAALRTVEVIRQPFMSNPSWLSKGEMAALEELR